MEKKLELKILPKSFENALNSNDKSVSNVYKEWREKDFSGWWTMGELKQASRADRPNTDKEWLDIFPEAKKIIAEKIAEYEETKIMLLEVIKQKIQIIKDKSVPENQWFWREWLKVNEVEDLVKIEKHITRLKFLRSVTKGRVLKGQITEEDIQRAKSVPIENIINTPLRKMGGKLMTRCPFHDDKHPSFYIYPETNSCWCFSCGQGGDSISFVMSFYGLNFLDAVRRLNGIK